MQWFDPRMAGWYRKGSVPKSKDEKKESREKREERREKKETSTTKITRSKDAMVRSQNGGMVQKRVGPYERREESREKKEETREKKETNTTKINRGGIVQNMNLDPRMAGWYRKGTHS